MALSNYSELKTAIENEISNPEAEFTDSIPDFISRAEAKINRRCRMREQEQQATLTYGSTDTTRRIAVPTGLLEVFDLRVKKATEATTSYSPLQYASPRQIHRYYDASELAAYTLRDELELNATVDEDHTLIMHYLKKWDIATDTTNYLLTNYPDVYLYGACAEAEIFMYNDPRIVIWKSLFDEGIAELNALDHRSRDDAILDVSGYNMRGRSFNVLTN